MNRTLCILAFLATAQSLPACNGQPTHPSNDKNTVVNASHSIYIEGGVLKVLSADTQNILFVYVRPEVTDQWIATGGGGGMEDKPWLFKSALSWTLGDENGEYSNDAPKKAFSFLFNGQNMTLTVDTGTYAVRREGFIVIALDSNWRTSAVKSGIESLRIFNIPEDAGQHLLNEARKHYTGQ
ncbi:MAG: hypothetical protein BMS9Abin06_0766 [Gammaproteobacteria bacterium]|nr:MAG: hypothetical protein BMS9Abin06_0766 [Gammaproteobacteria bacterium]